MHNHEHPTECEHINLGFCKKCSIVYCKDCGKEWYDKCTLNHTPFYPWTVTSPIAPCTTTTPDYYGQYTTGTYTPNKDIQITFCNHK